MQRVSSCFYGLADRLLHGQALVHFAKFSKQTLKKRNWPKNQDDCIQSLYHPYVAVSHRFYIQDKTRALNLSHSLYKEHAGHQFDQNAEQIKEVLGQSNSPVFNNLMGWSCLQGRQSNNRRQLPPGMRDQEHFNLKCHSIQELLMPFTVNAGLSIKIKD